MKQSAIKWSKGVDMKKKKEFKDAIAELDGVLIKGEPAKAIQDMVKMLAEVRDELSLIAADKRKYEEQRSYWENMIATRLRIDGIETAKTDYGTIGLTTQKVPSITDWAKTSKWVFKYHPELISKRISATGWRELLDDGIKVPGVKSIELDKLSFRRTATQTKASRKK